VAWKRPGFSVLAHRVEEWLDSDSRWERLPEFQDYLDILSVLIVCKERRRCNASRRMYRTAPTRIREFRSAVIGPLESDGTRRQSSSRPREHATAHHRVERFFNERDRVLADVDHFALVDSRTAAARLRSSGPLYWEFGFYDAATASRIGAMYVEVTFVNDSLRDISKLVESAAGIRLTFDHARISVGLTGQRSPAPTAREKSTALGTTAPRSASGAAFS
jgi:hypothetical protein